MSRDRVERAELLVVEIGSTITKLSAFSGLDTEQPRFLDQATTLTTVEQGNVVLGFQQARERLERESGLNTQGAGLLAAASAAGGLRMSAHGLTRDMTLRAAREASLGAGANLVLTTAGELGPDDLDDLTRSSPNLILLAGGVDFGDKSTVVHNARILASAELRVPLIYAGNRSAAPEVERIFRQAGKQIWVVENVYPRIDELNVKPVREAIQEVFSRHIVTAPGMEEMKGMISGEVLPTPGAVLAAAEMLYQGGMGDLMAIDVGGATTDVHSVTQGSAERSRLRAAPEPLAKRTVEGDLGVYYNMARIIQASAGALPDMAPVRPLPLDEAERERVHQLTRWAVNMALWRHAGELRVAYGAYGPSELLEGRDLTAVRTIVGTGGALTRLKGGREILSSLWSDPKKTRLLPDKGVRVLMDAHYIMASSGVLARRYPQAARSLLLQSLGIEALQGAELQEA